MCRRLAPLEAKGERTWFFFLCLALLNIVDSFNLNVVWPMLPFMVEGYGVARDPKDLGAWVGVAGAAVSVGQLISSYAWGALSDRIGRRPVMLLGMFNSTFSVLIFGTAKTYAQCVAGRFLSGLLNGNAGVVKTYVGETTEKTQQAAAVKPVESVPGSLPVAFVVAFVAAVPVPVVPSIPSVKRRTFSASSSSPGSSGDASVAGPDPAPAPRGVCVRDISTSLRTPPAVSPSSRRMSASTSRGASRSSSVSSWCRRLARMRLVCDAVSGT